MIEKLKNKKIHIAVTFGAIVAGVMLFQGVIPKEAREPKIDSISPSEGPVGTQVTITGSGFTTSFAGISGTKVKENVLPPGNYVLIKDEVVNQPLISPDGTTLTLRIDLLSDKLTKECMQKFTKKKPEPCKVHLKVINAYGKPSNEKEFTITGLEVKKLSYSVTRIDSPQTSPTIIHITNPPTEIQPVEVARIRISTPLTNEHPIVVTLRMLGQNTDYSAKQPVLTCSALAGDESYVQNVNNPTQEVYTIMGWPIGTVGWCEFVANIGEWGAGIFDPGYDFSHLLLMPGTQKDFAIKIKPSAVQANAQPGTFIFRITPIAGSWWDQTQPAPYISYPVENDGFLSYQDPVTGVITSFFRSNPIQFVIGQ